MARRARGSGHIRQRSTKSGPRFDVMVREGGKLVTVPHPRGGACVSREEAEALLNTYLHAKREDGDFVPYDTGIITLRQLGNLYLDGKSGDARSIWAARVVDIAEFIDWPLHQIDSRAVRRWVDRMAKTPAKQGRRKGKPPARTTVQNAINLLRDVFRWGVMPAQGYTDHNPVEGVTIRGSTDAKPPSREGRGFDDYLTEAEVRCILDAPQLPADKRISYVLLAFTGPRPIDLWNLTWDRVDVEAGRISYCSQKTEQEYLVHCLPLPHHELRLWWLAQGRPRRGPVIPTRTGGHHTKGYDAGWSDKKYTQYMAREGRRVYRVKPGWRQKLGIARDIPLYSLRHTCACQLLLGSELFTGGRIWSKEEIQSQLGHTSSKATERYMLALGITSRRAAEESRQAVKRRRGG